MKPETKQLRDLLRSIGVDPDQVRTDRAFGTTATVDGEDSALLLVEHAHALAAHRYAVLVRCDSDGVAYGALVTNDPRRNGEATRARAKTAAQMKSAA